MRACAVSGKEEWHNVSADPNPLATPRHPEPLETYPHPNPVAALHPNPLGASCHTLKAPHPNLSGAT